MKKLFLTNLVVFTNTLFALPVGNPAEASFFCEQNIEPCECSLFSYGIGFYGDYVFNRHMETDPGRNVDIVKLFTNAGYLVFNFKKRAELFATLGASRLSLNTSLVSFNSADPFPLFEIESGSAFSYSIGGRATLFHYKCASFGIEGQYFSTKPDIKRVYIAAGASRYLDDILTTHYSEWQLGAGISYRYNPFFIPYFAVKYSRSHWKLANGQNIIIESNTNTFFHNLHNHRNWGYCIGLTLYPECCERLAVSVEVRFPDEKAAHVKGQIRY